MQRDAATARARAHRSAGDGARETQASSKLKSAGPSSSSAEACPTPAEYVMLSSRGGRPHDDDATAPAPSSSSPRRHTDMDDAGAGASGRVLEWVTGLPAAAELTPVSHQLIPPALAAAFGIKLTSVFAASSSSLFDSALVHGSPASHLSSRCDEDGDEEGEGETEDAAPGGGACRRGRAGKKARMVWTPELHRRFVEAVGRFGHKRAVPKAIVRAMNVDGLTRENVASHLQKYRLYLKRTSTTATPPPLPSLPPAYGSPFSTQLPPNISNRSGYCAFLPRDNEKLERD